jgi:hypothetical protein
MAIARARRTPATVRLLGAGERERAPQTGAVGSVQEAEVTLPATVLERLWRAEYLERLALAYWRYITRATLGLVRVVYGEDSRTVVLLSRRLPLLRFGAPEYETSSEHGSVTWPIQRGLLVASEGRDRGLLRIAVRRVDAGQGLGEEADLHVRLEVRNFYPWLRGSGRFARFGAWLYSRTQLRIHLFVCNGFLRSLARLDLPPSRFATLAGESERRGAV